MMEQAWGSSLRASRCARAVGVRWAWVTGASLLLVGLALAGAAPARAQEAWPGASWTSATPASVGMDPAKTRDAIAYGAARGGSGILIRSGKRVGYWGSQTAKYNVKSSTKSVGSIILGLAIKDNLVGL